MFPYYSWNQSSSSSSHSQRGPSRRSSMMTASKGLSLEVGWCCCFGFGRSICHAGDQADDSRKDGEDDRVIGWRETVGYYVLGCRPAVWRCVQRRRCDDVGWRRWWQVGQWAQIFPSCERTASMRFSGFCVDILCGMPPGTLTSAEVSVSSMRPRNGRNAGGVHKQCF